MRWGGRERNANHPSAAETCPPGRRGPIRALPHGCLVAGLLATLLSGTPAAAAAPVLVRDLNPVPASSEPELLGRIGSRLILVASDGVHGPEPWVTDGTRAGTRLLRDIRPGSQGTWIEPEASVSLPGRMLFPARDGAHGLELWVTDGTRAGTHLVRDIRPGVRGSSLWTQRAVGDRVVLLADDGVHGEEPWVTDGTHAGTHLLKDIRPGPQASRIDLEHMVVAGGRLYFQAHDGTHGWEPWTSDGTPAGTRMLKDIRPGLGGSCRDGCPLVSDGDGVVFPARDGVHGWEPWTSDGTPAGTRLVKDIRPGVASGVDPEWTAMTIGDRLLFSADDGAHGREPWVSDGTVDGTALLADLSPGDPGSEPYFGKAGGAAIVVAADGTGSTGIWGSDGTPAGTERLGTIDATTGGSAPDWWPRIGGATLFTVGAQLWASDGTAGGTRVLLTGIREWGSPPMAAGARLQFGADDGTHGMEPWVSDGTVAGTGLLRDVRPGSDGSYPGILAASGGMVLFTADDGSNGREPWASDGTPGRTRLLADAWKGPGEAAGWSGPWAAAVGGRFLFAATDRTTGTELWASDGSPAGTARLRDLLPGTRSPGVFDMAPLRGRLIVGSESDGPDGSYGRWLWRSDGTTKGTVRFADLAATVAPTYGFTPVGDRLHLFHADQNENITTLLVTDGAQAGTRCTGWRDSDHVRCARGVALGDSFLAGCGSAQWGRRISGGLVWSDGSKARYLVGFPLETTRSGEATTLHDATDVVVAGDRAFFLEQRARILDHGRLLRTAAALWRSDGTKAGTKRITGLDIGTVGDWSVGGHQRLVAAGRHVAFAARDDRHGMEPWIGDGTAVGTHLGTDIRPGPAGSRPAVLASVLDHLVLSADDGRHGAEPWIGEETAQGMRLLSDIRPGPAGSDPSRLVEAGGLAYFSAGDGTHGRELWVTDGTGGGTHLVRDIVPGRGSAAPTALTRVGRIVYFVATDRAGAELWRSDGTAQGTHRVADLWPGRIGSRPTLLTAVGGALYFIAEDGFHGRELWRVVFAGRRHSPTNGSKGRTGG